MESFSLYIHIFSRSQSFLSDVSSYFRDFQSPITFFLHNLESSNFMRRCEYIERKTPSKIFQNFSNTFPLDKIINFFWDHPVSIHFCILLFQAENLKPCNSISQSDAQDIKIESEKDSISLEISSSGMMIDRQIRIKKESEKDSISLEISSSGMKIDIQIDRQNGWISA